MAKPFDPILKVLAEVEPADWVALSTGRYVRSRVRVFPADVSSVGGAVDALLRVEAAVAWLLHLEFQTGHDGARLPGRLWLYNALLEAKHELMVRSVAVLLRPEADSPVLTGEYTRQFDDEPEPHVVFRYRVVRVWELDPEALLAGGISTLPLAPISNVRPADLPSVLERMKKRLTREKRRVRELWAATYILMGLRYSPDLADTLLRGVLTMKESSTYQAILAEGRAEGRAEGAIAGEKKLLRLQGTERFGAPDARVLAALDAIHDPEKLEALGVRLLTAADWYDLLGLPAPRASRRRKVDS
jgi:predicted transposase YdaD